MAVFDVLQLYTTSDKYIVQSIESNDEVLEIDRVSRDIQLKTGKVVIPADATSKTIYGIVGIIRLIAGPYLVVITQRQVIGELGGHVIWKVTGTDMLPYSRSMLQLNDVQAQDNKQYMGMVQTVLQTDGLYCSATYDLTHTLQRLYNTSPDFLAMALHERADERFVWNRHLLQELSQQRELSRYCLPIVCGFVEIRQCSIKGSRFVYSLISRRSCFRAGTRFNTRGLDSDGHSANYVETEQIVESEAGRTSFVQTRGSIPLYWTQKVNLKYKPLPVITDGYDHVTGFMNHINSQILMYGKQVLVNLVDHKGSEDRMQKAFQQVVTNTQNGNVRYEAFDFHRECKNMQWHRLDILIDRLDPDLRAFSYFMMTKDGACLSQQDGVFRTNCMDCLDRTNVVQSLLAARSLQAQLVRLGLLSDRERLQDQTGLYYVYKNVWADNADAVSVQYAGTGALKTDYTRTGKRTLLGALKDGWNSAVRYVKNNFYDGFRQDSVDLFLGNYVVDEAEGRAATCPLNIGRDWKFYVLPLASVVAFAMMMVSLILPDEHFAEQLMYVTFWGAATVLCLSCIYFYGHDFVDTPKLAAAKSESKKL